MVPSSSPTRWPTGAGSTDPREVGVPTRRRRMLIGVGALAVAGAVLAVGNVLSTDNEPRQATATTAPLRLAPDGPALDEAAAALFADSPLCDNSVPPAPSLDADFVLISALQIQDGCVQGVVEGVPTDGAQERVAELRADDSVIAATIEQPVQDIGSTAASPRGPAGNPRRGEQWALDTLKVGELWDRTRGESLAVGVLEISFDTTHEDLQANQGQVRIHPSQRDVDGHGSHVTGVVSADDNDVGVVGVAPASPLVFVSRTAQDLNSQLTAALAVRRAVDDGARVLNLSFFVGSIGQLNRDDAHMIEVALRYASSRDTVVVMANGNCASATTPTGKCPEAANTLYFPQVLATVDGDWNDALLTVSASDRNGRVADFSTRLIPPTIAAPGVDILSTVAGGYATMSGTSMAAPHVTGVAALLRASHPSLTAAQVVEVLRLTAFGAARPPVPGSSIRRQRWHAPTSSHPRTSSGRWMASSSSALKSRRCAGSRRAPC